MKKTRFNFSKLTWLLIPALSVLFLVGCGDDDEPVDPGTSDNPIASFQFEVDDTDFLQVTFTNFSQNATTYAWDFGDGNTSTEENPVHTYDAGGDYTITLTASNAAGASAERTEDVSLTDPNSQLALLAGTTSKTWYLLREGIALGVGPVVGSNEWWSFGGVTALAERPCILDDSYTFHRDGTFEFNSNGTLFVDATANGGWIINGEDQEGCYDESESGVWGDNADREAFANGGDYTFDYDNVGNSLTLNGSGAYIGLCNKTADGDNTLPVQMKTYTVTNLAEGDIADTLAISIAGADFAWNFSLVSYANESDLPEIPTDIPTFGEDLPDVSPTEMFRGFASADASDFILLDTIISGSTVDYGVDDPADPSAPKVGQFNRTDAQFQELQFQTSPDKNDINFENLTIVSVDVYLPSSNDYSGSLTNNVIIGLADFSATAQWWTDHTEYLSQGTDLPLDQWVTLEYSLDTPDFVANPDNGNNPKERNDYDMTYIQFGGGDHQETGTFYVRNFRFQ